MASESGERLSLRVEVEVEVKRLFRDVRTYRTCTETAGTLVSSFSMRG